MGALISFGFSWPAAHDDRVTAPEALKVREPLIQAVFNLETRLHNLLNRGRQWDRVQLRLCEQLGGHDG
jgi:hypothetical protein